MVELSGKEYIGTVNIDGHITDFRAGSASKIVTKIQKFLKGQNL